MRPALKIGMLLILALGLFPPAASATLAGDVIPEISELNGIWTYGYTLNNLAASDESMWYLTIANNAPVFNILTPANWSVLQSGENGLVEWDSAIDPDGAYDLWPGGSLAGFSFQSLGGPGPSEYQIEGWMPNDEGYGSVINGTTEGPVTATAPIPEPGTSGLFALAIMTTLVIARFKFLSCL
jgi:hypothetical protein